MSRWVVHARAAFEARHALTSYLGEPEEPHGHRWQVAVRAGTDKLNAEGYAVDFHAVHEALARAVAPLDGTDLNDHPEIGDPTPSAERVAEVVAGWVAATIEELGARLLSVSVWEGPENRVDLVLGDEGVRG
jgi:6-pyruvoyltetrahydropterin/6-carboxytetrahydropterin synthase